MTIYKRKGSDNWYYEFQFKGQTYKGTTGTANKVEAQKVELKKRDEAQENHANKAKGVKRATLKQAVDLWLAWADVNLSDPRHYHGIARKLFGVTRMKGQDVKNRWGLEPSKELHQLCQADLMDLVDQRQQEGLSNATINRELSLIQSVLTWAKPRRFVMPPEDALTFSEAKLEEGEGKLRYLTEAEEDTLLAALWDKAQKRKSPHAQDQYDLTVLWLDTGCRYTEATTLMWDVVDFERGSINLYRKKVGNEADLAMTSRLREVLTRRRELTEGRRFIFPAGHGSTWSREDTHRGYSPHSIRKTMDDVGLNRPELVERFGTATIHTFRDTFATRLVMAGLSLYKVQKLLGHTTPIMTQKYAKLLVKDVSQEAVAILDRAHKARSIKSPNSGEAMQVECLPG